MADGRHVGKYSKCHNSPTNGPTETQLGWSHPIMSSTCHPRFGCHGNGRCLATAHWTFCSWGRTRETILIKCGTQQQVRTAMTVTWLNIKIFKIQNGGWPSCWNRRKFGQVWGSTALQPEVIGKLRCRKTPLWTIDYHMEKSESFCDVTPGM